MKKSKLTVFLLASLLAVNGTGLFNTGKKVSAEAEDGYEFDLDSLGIRGDINDDGVLSVFDLMTYKKYLLGGYSFPCTDYMADLNGDKKNDIADCIILKSVLLGDTKIWSGHNMPVMDGSTSAIPLEAGFKAKMLGINYTDAKTLVNHHKTHESFQMLLSGENDMIFTVPISDSQKADAEKAGVRLNLEPVAKEGFVFVVNKNNPVDSLTQQQIRDIYAGRITNWKEVGGNDEKILPYQRNTDSGSQNYMVDFMKDDTLAEPLKEYKIGSMGSLMDAIAVYDNAEGAIGYSVYSYAAQMYENSADVKFIAVDGVKPSRETMSDSTYPLLSSTYIMYTDKASKNTLDFVNWAVSAEGQKCVLENGYVPVMDIEYPDRLKLYRAVGTGKEKPADYKPDNISSVFSCGYYPGYDHEYDASEFSVDFLKDKEFEKTVNADIASAVEYVGKDAVINLTAKNGYMSVMIYSEIDVYFGRGEYARRCPDKIVTLNYDLINSRKTENFSDLFYKDADFVQMVNDGIARQISNYDSEILKTDFLGITGSVKNFTIENLVSEDDNPYFTAKVMPAYDSYWLPDLMVTGEYFDMRNVVDIEKVQPVDIISRNEWLYENTVDEDGELHKTPVASAFHTDEEVAAHRKLIDKIYAQAVEIRKNLDWGQDRKIMITDPYISIYDKGLNVYYADFGKIDGPHSKYMFDPVTGDSLKLSDIFGDAAEQFDDTFQCFYGIDMENGAAKIVTMDDEGMTQEIELGFEPDSVDSRFVTEPSDRYVTVSIPLETPKKGEFSSDSGWGYKSSYVLEHGKEEKQWPIEGKWHLTAKNVCISWGTLWYECWDSDDGDYYGWIQDYNIEFY